jgi:hypothetical protein
MGANQEIRIGRTEWADFSIGGDGQMSGVHFMLQTDSFACYILDLGSSNGTFVNGQPIAAKTTLTDGDQILAGATQFTVRTEGDSPSRASVPASERVAGGSVAALALAARAKGGLTYTAETCASGLTLCRGRIEQIQPQDLAALLGQVTPVYLIVDFKNLGVPPPEALESPDYLFDWFEPVVAAQVSPVVLAQADYLEWPSLVETGWGCDAVVCLFSEQDKAAVFEHLRRAVRVKPRGKGANGSIIGYCWPGVMAMLLSHDQSDFVGKLLSQIDAVLVELPDLPETWQLFGSSRITDVLDRLGFVQEPPEKADREDSENQE